MPTPTWWIKTSELSSGREGSSTDIYGKREYTRVFQVLVRYKGVASVLVERAPGIPYLWSPYTSYQTSEGVEYDTGCPLVKISSRQADENGEGEFVRWIVTCQYSTDLGAFPPQAPNPGTPGNPGNNTANPEVDPPEVEWGSETMQRAFPTDRDGFAYTNSAGVPFKPAPAIEIGFRTYTVTRNELSPNEARNQQYAYALNSDDFMGYGPRLVQCMPVVSRAVFKGTVAYWRVTYKFRFFPDLPSIRVLGAAGVVVEQPPDWQTHILDAGTMALVAHPLIGAKKILAHIKANGQNVTEDVLLDGDGLPAVAVNGQIPPTYIKFNSYPELPFAALMGR